MSLFKNCPGEIRAFKFTNHEKIYSTSLQNILKHDNDCIGFVEIQLSGIEHVYSLIDFSKVRNFNIDELTIHNSKTFSKQWLEESEYMVPFHLAKIIEDCPVVKDVNLKSNIILLDTMNIVDWILLYQFKNIINGLNRISDERDRVLYSIGFGDSVDDNHPMFDLSQLDFSYLYKEYPFYKYKYILKYSNNVFEFCNEIYNTDFEGIFVYIPNFRCWQYMSKKKYKNLMKVKSVDINYATTDSPRCFSDVRHHQEYNIDTFNELLTYGIYIPLDMYFSKVFEDSAACLSIGEKRYDALEISVKGREYQISVLLTHDELGITQRLNNEDIKTNTYDDINLTNYIRYMDKFCLIKLINKIILLKP
jgi:hypothetical protein